MKIEDISSEHESNPLMEIKVEDEEKKVNTALIISKLGRESRELRLLNLWEEHSLSRHEKLIFCSGICLSTLGFLTWFFGIMMNKNENDFSVPLMASGGSAFSLGFLLMMTYCICFYKLIADHPSITRANDLMVQLGYPAIEISSKKDFLELRDAVNAIILEPFPERQLATGNEVKSALTKIRFFKEGQALVLDYLISDPEARVALKV